MYTRSKEGAFKYQLTDILPSSLCGKDINVHLKIELNGENSELYIGQLSLCKDNEVVVLQRACEIR